MSDSASWGELRSFVHSATHDPYRLEALLGAIDTPAEALTYTLEAWGYPSDWSLFDLKVAHAFRGLIGLSQQELLRRGVFLVNTLCPDTRQGRLEVEEVFGAIEPDRALDQAMLDELDELAGPWRLSLGLTTISQATGDDDALLEALTSFEDEELLRSLHWNQDPMLSASRWARLSRMTGCALNEDLDLFSLKTEPRLQTLYQALCLMFGITSSGELLDRLDRRGEEVEPQYAEAFAAIRDVALAQYLERFFGRFGSSAYTFDHGEDVEFSYQVQEGFTRSYSIMQSGYDEYERALFEEAR